MCERSIDERLNFLEFRQILLFNNTSIDRLLFDCQVRENQYHGIMDLMERYRNDIQNGNEVHHATFEREIYSLVPQQSGNHHFPESIAQEFHRNGRWEEVFVSLYGEMPKFRSYLECPR